MYEMIDCLVRDANGICLRTRLACETTPSGITIYTSSGQPYALTDTGRCEIKGWGEMDGVGIAYTSRDVLWTVIFSEALWLV